MRVYILCRTVNGFGDLLFGLKTAQNLRSHYSSKTDIVLFVKEEDIEKLRSVAKQEIEESNITVQNITELESESMPKDSEGKLAVDLVIDGPCPRYFEILADKFNSETPVLLLTEYNWGDIDNTIAYINKKMLNKGLKPFNRLRALNTGIGYSDEKMKDGIFVDSQLESFSSISDPSELNDARTVAFEALNPTLRATLLDEKHTKDYLANTEISFFYHSCLQPDRVATSASILAAANTQNDKDIDLVVLGEDEAAQFLTRNLMRDQLVHIKKNGYSRIEWIRLGKSSRIDLEDPPQKEGKTFRIISASVLEHLDIVNLMKLSTVVGVTGDQSLSEALSCGVIPIYSYAAHKSELFSELFKAYERLGFPDVAEMFEFLSLDDNKSQLEKWAHNLPHHKERFQLANRAVRKDFNLNHTLTSTCDDMLSKPVKDQYQQGITFFGQRAISTEEKPNTEEKNGPTPTA